MMVSTNCFLSQVKILQTGIPSQLFQSRQSSITDFEGVIIILKLHLVVYNVIVLQYIYLFRHKNLLSSIMPTHD